MKDYLQHRQNVTQAGSAELNAKLHALTTVFGEDWLDAAGPHPLQLLWSRQDALATNELLNFGDAVERLHSVSPQWLKAQVELIKGGDSGQSAGAIFEIVGLNLFCRDTYRVIPAPAGKPGFDGTVLLKDGAAILVSLKNHGISSPERQFLASAREFDSEFQTQLKKSGLGNVEVNVTGFRYLEKADFRSLKGDMARCLLELRGGATGGVLERPYQLTFRDLSAQYGRLSTHDVSSCCRILAPMARNEQANFQDAIRKACDNLYVHTRGVTGDFCRMIILRLSNSASLSRCKESATWYFETYPEDPVDVIILYQQSVSVELSTGRSSIVHHVVEVLGPRFAQWQRGPHGTQPRVLTMRVFVGVLSRVQSTMQLISQSTRLDVDSLYIYQRGDIFQSVELRDGLQIKLSNPAPGVVVHAIAEQPGAPPILLSPKVGREQTLTLLP
jgi:hypothetical protein